MMSLTNHSPADRAAALEQGLKPTRFAFFVSRLSTRVHPATVPVRLRFSVKRRD